MAFFPCGTCGAKEKVVGAEPIKNPCPSCGEETEFEVKERVDVDELQPADAGTIVVSDEGVGAKDDPGKPSEGDDHEHEEGRQQV